MTLSFFNGSASSVSWWDRLLRSGGLFHGCRSPVPKNKNASEPIIYDAARTPKTICHWPYVCCMKNNEKYELVNEIRISRLNLLTLFDVNTPTMNVERNPPMDDNVFARPNLNEDKNNQS